MYCPNCGKTIKDYDNFCRYCGADLREEPDNQEIITKINRENEIKKEEEENVKILIFRMTTVKNSFFLMLKNTGCHFFGQHFSHRFSFHILEYIP